MANKDNRLTQLRKDVDKLRKSYGNAMSSANKAVYQGIDKLAEHELAALKKHYEEALKNLKKLRKGGDPKDLATEQLRLLQDTIDRIMNNARESLSILDQTRKQIAEEVRKNLDGPATASAGSSTKAKKPSAKRKATATKSTAKKSTAKKSTAKKASASKAKSTSAAKKSTASKPKSGSAGKKTTARKTTTRSAASKKTTSTTAGTGQTATSSGTSSS